jgi:hypothetical protein
MMSIEQIFDAVDRLQRDAHQLAAALHQLYTNLPVGSTDHGRIHRLQRIVGDLNALLMNTPKPADV